MSRSNLAKPDMHDRLLLYRILLLLKSMLVTVRNDIARAVRAIGGGPEGVSVHSNLAGTLVNTPDRLQAELETFRKTLAPAGQWIMAFARPALIAVGMRVGRVIPPAVTLRTLPEGTFGNRLGQFIEENQLNSFGFGSRRNQTHDALHVLLGLGVDYTDEAALQFFLLGRRPSLANVMFGFSFALRTGQIRYCLHSFRLARNTKLDPDFWPYEEHWGDDLITLRQKLGLTTRINSFRRTPYTQFPPVA